MQDTSTHRDRARGRDRRPMDWLASNNSPAMTTKPTTPVDDDGVTSFAADALDSAVSPTEFLQRYAPTPPPREREEDKRLQSLRELLLGLESLPTPGYRGIPKEWYSDDGEKLIYKLIYLRRESAQRIATYCTIEPTDLNSRARDLCLTYRTANKALVAIYQTAEAKKRAPLPPPDNLPKAKEVREARTDVDALRQRLVEALKQQNTEAAQDIAADLGVAARRLRQISSALSKVVSHYKNKGPKNLDMFDYATMTMTGEYAIWQMRYANWMNTDAGIVVKTRKRRRSEGVLRRLKRHLNVGSDQEWKRLGQGLSETDFR